jgi:multiple sugar transport system substrate-binding protein
MQRSTQTQHPRRSRRAAALVIAAGLAASACSGTGAGSTELSEEPVTLRVTWWGSDARHERTQQVIELFEDEYPNITVTGEFKEWTSYWDSLATTVAANDAPDVIQMDELYLASYAERGALLDLGTVGEHLDTSAVDEDVLTTGVVDEKQYAVPAGLAAYSVVVNADLLAQYGIPLPDDDTWTWADLKELGAQVSAASGGAVTGVQSWGFNDAGGLHIWARQAGGELFDEEGNVAIEPEVLVNYWTYLDELAKEGIAPSPAVTIERSNAGLDQSGTATNSSAFAMWWNTQLTSLTAASGADLQLLKLPGEADNPGSYHKPSMFWSVFSRSEHPAEAALFVDFLTNSEAAGEVMLTDRGVPTNDKIRAAIAPKLEATDQAAVSHLDEIEVTAPPRLTPTGASNIEAILSRHTEQVLFGQLTPEQAATSFIDELQAEIDAAA